MDRIPSNIIFEIFSRVPARCLARSRCVSRVWCKYIDDRYLTIIHDKRVVEEPTPILYHQHLCLMKINLSLCFHVSESKQAETTHLLFEPKNGQTCRSCTLRIESRGSCNGLICLSQDIGYVITSLAVIHPLRKECYELPPFPLHFTKHVSRESCGLGFDAFTNTWKMVCVFLKANTPPDKPDMVKKNLCTLVHVFGTNSWRELPQVSSYPITGKAVFANGCLHWLVSHIDMETEDGGREVIWFDVNNEEFGLIKRPKRMCNLWRNYSCSNDHLVDLNGEVGYVCTKTMEFWLLNHNKEWVPHCRFAKEIPPENAYIYVMGCWNKDGDILIKSNRNGMYAFFIYNLKSGVLQKNNIAGKDDAWSPKFIMYPHTLSSIHDINTNSTFCMKKTFPNKSCQHVLSFD